MIIIYNYAVPTFSDRFKHLSRNNSIKFIYNSHNTRIFGPYTYIKYLHPEHLIKFSVARLKRKYND